jgi:serine/threonine protein kinase/tetratricopeptide (TPR) repeat protein
LARCIDGNKETRERKADAGFQCARATKRMTDETPGVTGADDPLEDIRKAIEGRYRIRGTLGRGGNAVVYLAEDLKHPRTVAIKVLRGSPSIPLAAERFRREIDLLCAFQHPNILTLIEGDSIGGLRYYVMPHVAGGSLRDEIRGKRQLGVDESIRLGMEVAEALAYAHERGYVHRDIKPENILISSGRPMVADFGIARSVARGTGATLTPEGQTIGTPPYMSPEQITSGDLDGRSDVYSLGCVLFETLAGTPPFGGATDESIMRQHLTAPPPPVTQFRPQAGPGVSRILDKCLAKNPADRFASASALASALRECLVPSSYKPTATPAIPRPSRPPLPWARIAASIVLGLAILVAGKIVWNRLHPPAPEKIAVMPFAVHSDANHGYLGEGIVGLMSTALSGVARLQCIDSQSILVASPAAPSLGQAREIARRFGAGRFILGNIVEIGSQVHIQASIFNTRGGETPIAEPEADGDTSEIFALANRISQSALAALSGERLMTVAATTTQSLQAFRAYVRGDSALRVGNTQLAVDLFQEAVDADSQFSLAWYRLSWACQWNDDQVRALDACDHAFASSSRLYARDQLLLRGLRAYLYGATSEADSLFRVTTVKYPDDSEGWYMLGETYLHQNPIRAMPFQNAKEPFTKALDLWPKQWEARYHLAEIYAYERDSTALDTVVAQGLRVGLDPEEAYYQRVLRAFSHADKAKQDSLLAELRREEHLADPGIAMSEVAFFDGDLESASHFVETLTESKSPLNRARGYAFLCNLDLARGRVREARSQLQLARPLSPFIYANQSATLCLHPFLKPSATDLQSTASMLQHWKSADWSERSSEVNLDPPAAPYRDYLLGLLSLRLGKDGDAIQREKSLMAAPGPTEAKTTRHDFSRSIRADIAWRSGRYKEALKALAESPLVPAFVPGPRALIDRVYSRWQMAELLRLTGRENEAMDWYETLPFYSPFGIAMMGPAYLEAARIAERKGDRQRAARDYSKVIRLWQGCDPEFQPHFQEAQQGLARVTSRG